MSYIQKNYVEGKVVVITGASNGFGKETAEIIAEMGGIPVIGARREEKLKAVADGIIAKGGKCLWKVTDVSKKEDVFGLVNYAVEQCGKIDVLVNNACNMPVAYFADWEIALDKWEQCIDTGLKGTLYGMCAAYNPMMKQGEGQIINISSTGANYPAAGAAIYSAVKQAVNYITRSMRHECHGKIKLSTLSPSATMGTELAMGLVNPAASVGLAGHLFMDNGQMAMSFGARPELADMESIGCYSISPRALAENIVYLINQPMGVNISDITVRSTDDHLMV